MIGKDLVGSTEGKLLATGPGTVAFSVQRAIRWTVSENGTTAPTVLYGLTLQPGENQDLVLETGEFLWAFGSGIIHVIADTPGT